MQRRANKVIGVLLDREGFGRRVYQGIQRFRREHAELDFRPLQLDPHGLKVGLEMLKPAGVIGQLAVPAYRTLLTQAALPAVNVSMARPTTLPTVAVDQVAIGRLAAGHLLDRGFRHLACVHTHWTWFSQLRRAGFEAMAREADVSCTSLDYHNEFAAEMQKLGDSRNQRLATEANLSVWLSKLPARSGVLLSGEFYDADVVTRGSGRRVPEDVAVVVVGDDPDSCDYAQPSLSSVDLPLERVGHEAAVAISRLLEGRSVAERCLLEPTGVTTRLSTDAMALDDDDVAQAARYIGAQAHRGIRVSDVVAEVAVPRRTLEVRFRAAMGRSMLDEIRLRQFERARMLLAETDLPMELVAKRCGMKRQQRLCQVFRERLNTTPRTYRMRFRPT